MSEPRPPQNLGCLALVVSFMALGCVAFHFGPLLSLAVSVYAFVMTRRRPERYKGAGLAALAIATSLMAGAFVLTLRPYFNDRGELRYGTLMDRMQDGNLESSAWGSLRAFTSAEAQYALDQKHGYGTLECLRQPAQCQPPLPADTPPLLPYWPFSGVEANWTVTFHSLPETSSRGPATRLERVALTLVPKEPRSGRKAYCADSDGNIRFRADGAPPRIVIVDGLCDPSLPVPP